MKRGERAEGKINDFAPIVIVSCVLRTSYHDSIGANDDNNMMQLQQQLLFLCLFQGAANGIMMIISIVLLLPACHESTTTNSSEYTKGKMLARCPFNRELLSLSLLLHCVACARLTFICSQIARIECNSIEPSLEMMQVKGIAAPCLFTLRGTDDLER